jgi:hypothetical protein
MERGCRVAGKVRKDVVPGGRDLRFGEYDLRDVVSRHELFLLSGSARSELELAPSAAAPS